VHRYLGTIILKGTADSCKDNDPDKFLALKQLGVAMSEISAKISDVARNLSLPDSGRIYINVVSVANAKKKVCILVEAYYDKPAKDPAVKPKV
jgi:hypothetical protein